MPQGDITGFAEVVVGAKPAKIDAQEIPANPGNALDCITLQIDRPSAHPDTVPIAVATGFVCFAIIWGTLVLSRALERLERVYREVGSMEPPEDG